MNAPSATPRLQPHPLFRSNLKSCNLLPNFCPEKTDRALQAVIFQDIPPQAGIEWLLAIDVAELSWEIQRYRILRHKLLESYRQKAIEMTLRRIDVPGIVPHFKNDGERYIVQNALDWRLDCMAADEIEARLASYGFDQHTISVEVYVQAPRDVHAIRDANERGTVETVVLAQGDQYPPPNARAAQL
ncbi:hypothetical protein [Bradyrhizobium sp. 15]|uniref:hypothetical protein n=1 Tax=Bradyrhizobium sp. 15 TaxID=2782633 RepID=UPI001FF726E1|nr:hypothetical protein [Bradyrhizobium sp. 15]